MPSSILKKVAQEIESETEKPFTLEEWKTAGGGSINSAYLISGKGTRYFVKTNSAALLDMFAAEMEGLNEIASTKTIKVPAPVTYGIADHQAYIVLEYIEFGSSTPATIEALGRHLAAMHRATQANYGWHRNNTIGSTPQINSLTDDWCRFLAEHRFGFQIQLVREKLPKNRIHGSMERLIEALPVFFEDYHPQPSLLHGDLWSGNYAIEKHGAPVIFDPAVYYGDREADIAMTELFGGFPAGFYRAYNDAFTLDRGYSVRKTLYNLYHILNHYNLFGGGYLSQAQSMTDRLLSEIH